MSDDHRTVELIRDPDRKVEIVRSEDARVEPHTDAIGLPGASGATGPQGPIGRDGSTGATGAQGPAGADGATGLQGPTGNDGPPGATGPAGRDGDTVVGPIGWTAEVAAVAHGERRVLKIVDFIHPDLPPPSNKPTQYIGLYVGRTGFTKNIEDATDIRGTSGPMGPQGFAGGGGGGGGGGSGSPGATGATGPQGPPGSASTQGATGATGPQGPPGADGASGATGPQGPAGADGASGATGPAGPQGLQGATGPQGIPGAPGADGASGATGPQGPAGAAGAAGASGATGPQGPAGADGAAGPAGASGATGPAGPTGATGASGATGPAGTAGAQGATGATGPSGVIAASAPITYDSLTQTVGLNTAANIAWTGSHTFSLAAKFADGTAAAPGIAFINDATTGIFRPGTNSIALSAGGNEQIRIQNNGTDSGQIHLVGNTGTWLARWQGIGSLNNYYFAGAGNLTGTGADNVALGRTALQAVTSGGSNLGIGTQALRTVTTGIQNVAVGQQALPANGMNASNYNTALGFTAGQNQAEATGNTYIGRQAGYINLTGNYNIYIGYVAGGSAFANGAGSGNIFIGAGIGPTTDVSNTLSIANTIRATGIASNVGNADATGSVVTICGTAPTTSTTSGALVVNGGIGAAGGGQFGADVRITLSQDAQTNVRVTNSFAGANARAQTRYDTNVTSGYVGMASGSYTAIPILQNRLFMDVPSGLSIAINCEGAGDIIFGSSNTERFKIAAAGQLVSTIADNTIGDRKSVV